MTAFLVRIVRWLSMVPRTPTWCGSQVWLIHLHDMYRFLVCGMAQVTWEKWLLYKFTMYYLSVNIHSKPAWLCCFLLWSMVTQWLYMSALLLVDDAPSSFNLSVMLRTFHVSPRRTQKMAFSWMWMSRCPWCAVSWLRTQSWREDTMLWASPRGDSSCM